MNDFVTHLTLDLNCNKETPTIDSAQFDKSRVFSVSITSNGEPFDVSGCQVTLKCIHSDKSSTSLDCTDGISQTGTAVTVTLREDTLPVRGITAAKLVFSDGTRNYSTQIFLIDVDSCLEGNIKQSEPYSVLNRLIDQIIAIKNKIESILNKKSIITNQPQEGDRDTNYPTVGAVRDFVNLVKDDLESYVDDEIGNIPGITVDSKFSQTSTNPVQNKIVTAKFNEVDSKIAAIPTVTVDSDFSLASTNPVQNKIVTAKFNEVDSKIAAIPTVTVDSDFSLASTNPVQNKIVAAKLNEIVAGKADKANSLSGYGIKNAYNKTEVDYALAHKADKSTTLSGYGITNAYTKTEVDNALSSKADSSAIPTKTSQLNNDSGFLTQHQDISGKADKSTTLAGYGITDAYTKSEVDALVSGGVIPQYVIDESESVLAKAFAHKGLGRTIRFIAVSDSHNDATKASHDYTRVSNLHCGQAVKYIAERIPLDFVASLGDMTWAGVAHTTAQYQTDWLKADIQEMNMFLKDGFSGIPNIRVVGNHDQCATTDSGGTVSRLQNSGAYQYFGRYNAGANDGLSNYGYYDIENVKLRIIYLNTSDTVSTTSQGTLLNVSQEQKNWLCETLIDVNSKSDAADWKILLLSHAPLDMVSSIAADILIPYTNGGTYGSYTFTNHSAKIIGNCHGHTHCYNIGYISDVIRRFTIPNSNFYDNNHYKDNANYSAWNEDTTYPKTENSRTDTSFSLVTVDLDNDMCYIDNYGAGYDRAFNVDYKKAVSSISNLSYTGTTTVGQNIDISAISYTVIYSDGSTSSRTGGVTVSPASIQQAGNNTVAVSYTEGGITVTGSLTITGTAPPVATLLNLDRTEATAAADSLIPFDTTKYYKNIANGTAKGYNANCTVYSKSSDSISMKESGTGGITVGYPVELPNTSKSYTFSCDYNGSGNARIYYRIFDSSGAQLPLPNTTIINNSAATGSVNETIAAPGGNYKWLIIMFSSNTNGSKEYTNVSLTENN